ALLAFVSQNGVQAVQLGDWPAPFGITLVADHLSAIMVLLSAIMGLAVAIYSLADIDARRVSYGYYALYHVLLTGICGAFLTGDVFNLFVWFEVMLLASFVLLALGGERAQLDGAVKYVTINLVASAFFLSATGLLYGLTGSLNMADIAVLIGQVDNTGLVTAVAMMFLIAFGIKAGVFPLFFWLPASYHTPPVAVSAIFAGMLTKVGVYTLIRFFTLIFNQDVAYTHTLLLWIAGLTMITGVLGAAAQNEFRRILSFHIISQIGYMVMGLALYTPLALAGSVFYITHHIIVKTNLFLVSGVAQRLVGSFELKRLGGLYKSHPLVGVLFLVPAFSLAGFPPLSGFWAKYILVRAGLEVGQYAIVAVALVVGLLTVYSMTKIWNEVFWKALPQASAGSAAAMGLVGRTSGLGLLLLPVISLAVMTVIIGLYAGPFFALAERSAEELLAPAHYIEAVLGPQTLTETPLTETPLGETP
ncbi:MAG: Na+/H+ antiporter subunit D, partial [Deinococcota bacterium]|nr:Na+/H+ antiporter subunit D [Deinococcota bacterium]